MNFRKTVLENGLRIITVPQKESRSVTVLVLVEAGSEYETKDINGVSHFLEHMCFKGTKRRPTTLVISSELDNLGASYNAFTSFEYTGYYAKVESKHLNKILDIVSDLYLNPLFDPQEIDKERGVVIEEMNMFEDNPMERAPELFVELMYGDQPAGWNVAGTKEVINKLKREDFIKYRSDHYVSSATTIVVAGSFEEMSTIENIKGIFSGMDTSAKVGKSKTVEVQHEPQLLVKTKGLDQIHIVLGFRAFDIFDDRRYALEVLATILGGGMSSRLYKRVREELGAAYYIRAGSQAHIDHGYLAIESGINRDKLSSVLDAIIDEVRKIKIEKVSNEELIRAKNQLSARLNMALETSNSLAEFYGIQDIVERRILTPEEILERINSVSPNDILDIAKIIFTNNKLNLVVLGPEQDEKALRQRLSLD
ncbi:MAG TPA: pitrilysin family protein [Candidatus Paceibacterota bacterium]